MKTAANEEATFSDRDAAFSANDECRLLETRGVHVDLSSDSSRA